jgi:hypothetical protein
MKCKDCGEAWVLLSRGRWAGGEGFRVVAAHDCNGTARMREWLFALEETQCGPWSVEEVTMAQSEPVDRRSWGLPPADDDPGCGHSCRHCDRPAMAESSCCAACSRMEH